MLLELERKLPVVESSHSSRDGDGNITSQQWPKIWQASNLPQE